MEVFLLYSSDYPEADVLGVFSSRGKAEAYLQKYLADGGHVWGHTTTPESLIDEYEVDPE